MEKTEHVAAAQWAVLDTYRDDHMCVHETHLVAIVESEDDALARVATLQGESGFEKSDGGDGIETRFYTARQVRLTGQTATKSVVEVVTSTYVVEAIEGDWTGRGDRELVVTTKETTPIDQEQMWRFNNREGKEITLRKKADGSMYMDEYTYGDDEQANWGTLYRDRYHIAPLTGQILSKEPTDWEDYWRGEA
ncbi:MAG: hypothetical protein U0491_00620 [Candidatus Saccharimonadales bacterium]